MMIKRIAIGVVIMVGTAAAVTALVVLVPRHLVAQHQASITAELAEWQTEVRPIRSIPEARDSVSWIEYIRHYYPLGDGYRGTARSEAALETQRAATIDAHVSALKDFTGEDFGADVLQWNAYLDSVVADSGPDSSD